MASISVRPFCARFVGPEGEYIVEFTPNDDEGSIQTTIAGTPMTWHVEFVGLNDDGDVVLGGLTRGSTAVWGDCFWFEVKADAGAPFIEYWGNHVLWRKDRIAGA